MIIPILFSEENDQNDLIFFIQIVDYMVSFNSGAAIECAKQLTTLNLSQHDKQILNRNFALDEKWALV